MGHFIWDWVRLGGKLTCSASLWVIRRKMGMRYWVAFYGVLFFFHSVLHIISFIFNK